MLLLDLNNKRSLHFQVYIALIKEIYPEICFQERLWQFFSSSRISHFSSTLISIFSWSYVEFVSLGGLVKGLTLKDIMLGISQCCNEKLAAVFYRLQLIEAYGTGIPKIDGKPWGLVPVKWKLSLRIMRLYYFCQIVIKTWRTCQTTKSEQAVLALPVKRKTATHWCRRN